METARTCSSGIVQRRTVARRWFCWCFRPSGGELTGRIAAPDGACRNLLALHQEAVGLEDRTVAHRHAVVRKGHGADGDVVTEDDTVGLESGVFHGVALENGALAQGYVIAE